MRYCKLLIFLCLLSSGLHAQNMNMPTSGTTTYYTTGGKFYDNGGSGSSYSSSISGILVLYPAISGMKVSITFNSFTTESAGCTSDYDRLYIYNGNSTAAAALHPSTNSGGFWTGCAANAMTLPQTFTSTSADGSLTIRFKADGSATAAGWDADVVLSGSPCGGTFYDIGGASSNYINNLNYSFTITPPAGNYISLAFSAFATESAGCASNYDRFYLYDGNSTGAPALHPSSNSGGFWTGCAGNAMSIPQTFNSTAADGTLTMSFRSDGSTAAAGWTAAVSCISLAACSGSPSAGTVSITSSSGASGINYTMSVSGATTGSGISFQWQSSTDNISFSNIAGATGSSYTTSSPSSSSVIYYRLVVTCSNSGLSSVSNVVSYTVTSWNQPAGSGSATITTCSGTIYDHAGTGSYSNNQNSTMTVCPSVAGQCVRATFTSFGVEAGFDFLSVFDGNSTAAGMIPGSSFSGSSPGTLTATTDNSSGCLTFRFYSDGATTSSGWAATIGCTSSWATPVAATQQDCYGGQTICNSQSFTANSNGSGQFNEANFGLGNLGCLNDYGVNPDGSAEHQSSWYFFSATTAGTVGMTIVPSSSSTDYDWAIWGPYASVNCPPTGAPLRCSSASSMNSSGAITGMGNSAADLNEGSGGNGYVSTINVNAGDKFVMLLDNWNATSAPFTLNWQLGGGASLDCTPLPVDLLSFTGTAGIKGNLLDWSTSSETNFSHFEVQRSVDGKDYNFLELVKAIGERGGGTYSILDPAPVKGLNYYRLKQTDFDGTYQYSLVVKVDNSEEVKWSMNVFPNPSDEIVNLSTDLTDVESYYVEIYNMTGKLVFTESFINKEESSIDVSSFSSGIYYIKATAGGRTTSARFVKKK